MLWISQQILKSFLPQGKYYAKVIYLLGTSSCFVTHKLGVTGHMLYINANIIHHIYVIIYPILYMGHI